VLQALVRYAGFHARAGAGLTVLISRGDAISSADMRPRTSHEISIGVTASESNRLWLLADGTWLATLTDVEPVQGAQLCYVVTTDGANVTAIEDARRFVHRALVEWALELRATAVMSTAGTVALAAWGVVPFDAEVESVAEDLSDLDVSWTAGSIVADVGILAPGEPLGDGTGAVSLFTSSATDDRRPSIAFDATVLRSVVVDHEVRRIAAGSRVVLKIISTIAAPAPEAEQEIRVTLRLRRYR